MQYQTKQGWRAVRALLTIALLVSVLVGGTVPSAGAGTSATGDGGRQSYTGTIDGADYRVEMPEHWNGTLVLYSHGYYPPHIQFPVEGIPVANAAEAEGWLLDHGFALAASEMQDDGSGYHVAVGQQDQLALLDWFEANVGHPDRTIATGQSMGAAIAVALGERHPDRVDGVLDICGGPDAQATFNGGLDVTFAVRTLLTDDQDMALVRPVDLASAEADTATLVAAVDAAVATPEGQAKLALIAAFNNIPGWYSAHQPRPTDPVEQIRNQANWIRNAYVGGFAAPAARVDLEPKVGGNPSFNVGVDYRHLLERSSQTGQVHEAYRAAGVDLEADLAALDAAPRIAPDPAAVDFMYRTSVPRGEITVPIVTMHSVGDGGAIADQARWYAEQVRRRSDPHLIRQLYVDRGSHCSMSAADEVVALQAVLHKLDTGRWPHTGPHRLNRAVAEFDPHFQQVLDLGGEFDPETGLPKMVMPPAFTRFTPPHLLRPSL